MLVFQGQIKTGKTSKNKNNNKKNKARKTKQHCWLYCRLFSVLLKLLLKIWKYEPKILWMQCNKNRLMPRCCKWYCRGPLAPQSIRLVHRQAYLGIFFHWTVAALWSSIPAWKRSMAFVVRNEWRLSNSFFFSFFIFYTFLGPSNLSLLFFFFMENQFSFFIYFVPHP